ncbi:hypothetical protein F4212_07045 [Candidatus Poribacteria bacterium]|nr:hypothetical protein [Candidatus Poribacteria bacterium]
MMNWVDFQGVTFNLDHITHFYIIGTDEYSEIYAYLNIGYPGRWGIGDHQDYITIAKGTKEECKQWRNEIIAGQHNLPCKGHLYLIKDSLNQINETLGKIASCIERLSQKQ